MPYFVRSAPSDFSRTYVLTFVAGRFVQVPASIYGEWKDPAVGTKDYAVTLSRSRARATRHGQAANTRSLAAYLALRRLRVAACGVQRIRRSDLHDQRQRTTEREIRGRRAEYYPLSRACLRRTSAAVGSCPGQRNGLRWEQRTSC